MSSDFLVGAFVLTRYSNHSSFYFAQLVALKIMAGDVSGAMTAVQNYFSGPFQEQIVYKGEQVG